MKRKRKTKDEDENDKKRRKLLTKFGNKCHLCKRTSHLYKCCNCEKTVCIFCKEMCKNKSCCRDICTKCLEEEKDVILLECEICENGFCNFCVICAGCEKCDDFACYDCVIQCQKCKDFSCLQCSKECMDCKKETLCQPCYDRDYSNNIMAFFHVDEYKCIDCTKKSQ